MRRIFRFLYSLWERQWDYEVAEEFFLLSSVMVNLLIVMLLCPLSVSIYSASLSNIMMGGALMGYKWLPIGSTGPDDDDIGEREREREL